jgi:PAS domain S-box-containing protein
LIDLAGRINLVSPSFQSMLELPASYKMQGKPVGDYMPEDVALQFNSVVTLMKLNDLLLEHVELEFVTLGGRRVPVRLHMKPFTYGGAQLIHLSVEDVQELKEAQNELLETHLELELSYSSILAGWARTLELRDLETKGHSERVTNIMVDLALRMGFRLEEIVPFRHGAMLHDIGKVAIPDSVLLKPGPLNPDEWQLMKLHPVYGRELLSSIDYLQESLTIPYSHHERWDGTGYPEGLKGEEIPIEARMFAVIDVWDALGNPRPYRAAWPRQDTVDYIQDNSGRYFDPAVVQAFMSIVG